MENKDIYISTNLDKDDVYAVFKARYDHNIPLLLRLLIVFGSLGFTALALLKYNTTGGEFPFDAVVVSITILFFIFGVPLNLKYKAKKDFETNETLTSELNYTVDNCGVELKTATDNTRHRWDQIYGAEEQNDHFLIYMSKKVINIIPKRSFNDKSDIEVVRSYIQAFAPSPRKKNDLLMKVLRILGGIYVVFFLVSFVYVRFIK